MTSAQGHEREQQNEIGMPGGQDEISAVDKLACKAMTYCEVKSIAQHDLRDDKMGDHEQEREHASHPRDPTAIDAVTGQSECVR